MLRESLTDAGYAVATAPHGAAALELVKQHPPAVVLIDLRLPIMDGWAFIEQYRRIAKPPGSITLLSDLRDAEETAKRLHLDGFISKPFQLDEVSALVRRRLAGT